MLQEPEEKEGLTQEQLDVLEKIKIRQTNRDLLEGMSPIPQSDREPKTTPPIPDPNSESPNTNISPDLYPALGFLSRARYSFAQNDDLFSKTLLRDFGIGNVHKLSDGRYLVVDEEGQTHLTDESGFSFSDIADAIGVSPEMAGQFLGSLGGLVGGGSVGTAAAGPAGGFVAGTAGRSVLAGAGAGAGRAVSHGVAKSLGVETDDLGTEVRRSAAEAAAWEVAGLGLTKVGSRVLSPVFMKARRGMEMLPEGHWLKKPLSLIPEPPTSGSVRPEGEKSMGFWESLRRSDQEIRAAGKIASRAAQKSRSRAIPFIGQKINFYKAPLSDVTANRLINLLDKISSISMTGGGVVNRILRHGDEVVNDLMADHRDRFVKYLANVKATNPEEIGLILHDAIEAGFKAAEIPAKKLRNSILREATESGIIADASSLRKLAKNTQYLNMANLMMRENADDAMLSILNSKTHPTVAKAVKERLGLKKLPKDSFYMDVPQLIDTRTRIIKTIENLKSSQKLKDSKALPVLYRMKEEFNKVIEDVLGKANPELLDAWTASNKIFAKNRDVYKNTWVKAILSQADPYRLGGGEYGKVTQALFMNGRPERIRKVKEALLKSGAEGKRSWETIQHFVMADAFDNSLYKRGPFEGMFDPRKLLKILTGETRYGKQALSEIFKGNNEPRRRAIVLAKELSKRHMGGQDPTQMNPTVFWKLKEASGITGLVEGRPGRAAYYIGTPIFLSRFLYSDVGYDLLTRAVKTPVWAPEANALIGRIVDHNDFIFKSVNKYYDRIGEAVIPGFNSATEDFMQQNPPPIQQGLQGETPSLRPNR
jgi:hypothetical protein